MVHIIECLSDLSLNTKQFSASFTNKAFCMILYTVSELIDGAVKLLAM